MSDLRYTEEQMFSVLDDRKRLHAEIATLRAEVERLMEDLAATRASHAKLMRAIKTALGLKNWPEIKGSVVDWACAALALPTAPRPPEDATPKEGSKT